MEFDVIIVGGGITGAGCARDLSLRGLKVMLIERGDIADGATGRNHGLLHSGARYAVTDAESAEECIRENMILRKIAAHCVEETEGLFITLPEDDLAYQAKFIESCQRAGINAEAIDPALARKLEPSVNPALIGAVKVPDGAVDPFRLCASNIVDAKLHGAVIKTYTEVLSLLKEGSRVVGVKVYDKKAKEEKEYRSRIVLNAAGVWGQRIAQMAGCNVLMFPAKGSLLIFGHRVNNVVINRCRKPANADILVPGDAICLIGTTSTRVPLEECDNLKVTPEEVKVLLEEGCQLCPSLASTRILRAYAGVRPLVASDADPSGRSISRGIVVYDHSERDGVDGFVTITGGKLMTYRLMAEMAGDTIVKKLAIDAACVTRTTPLPGSEKPIEAKEKQGKVFAVKAAQGRHGTKYTEIDLDRNRLVCECEGVSVGEIEYATKNLGVNNLIDLRRRTRVGMGTCQGAFCACRAAGLLAKAQGCADKAYSDLRDFAGERHKGMAPVAWGDTLRESQYMQIVYKGVLGL